MSLDLVKATHSCCPCKSRLSTVRGFLRSLLAPLLAACSSASSPPPVLLRLCWVRFPTAHRPPQRSSAHPARYTSEGPAVCVSVLLDLFRRVDFFRSWAFLAERVGVCVRVRSQVREVRSCRCGVSCRQTWTNWALLAFYSPEFFL